MLPLKDDKVSGLINITHSAQYGVPCCTTKTLATSQYYQDEMLLMGKDAEEWARKISYLFDCNFTEYKAIAEGFQNYIKVKYSPKWATKQIINIIEENFNISNDNY